jgi:hypothetical protein
MYGCLVCVVPVSYTVTTFECAMLVAVRASLSNLRTSSTSDSKWLCNTLTATNRLKRVSSALYTDAVAPLPIKDNSHPKQFQ